MQSRMKLKEEPNKEEILKAVEKLNNNSAPGLDGVTSKLVKFLVKLIPDLFVKAIKKEINGQDGKTFWTRMRKMILIQKRDTDKKTIKKLRPIMLLSAIYLSLIHI